MAAVQNDAGHEKAPTLTKTATRSLSRVKTALLCLIALLSVQSSWAAITNVGTNYSVDCSDGKTAAITLPTSVAYTVTFQNCGFTNQSGFGIFTKVNVNLDNVGIAYYGYVQGFQSASGVGSNYKINFTTSYVALPIQSFSTLVALLPAGSSVSRQVDSGAIVATFNGQTYSVQPAASHAIVSPSVTGLIAMESDGNWHFTDTAGLDTALYPAFAEPVALNNVLLGLDPNSAITVLADGTASIWFKGQTYTLVPDLTMSAIPANRVGQSWWQESATRYWFANQKMQGTAQGLTIKQ